MNNFSLKQKMNFIKQKIFLYKNIQEILPSLSSIFKKDIYNSSINVFTEINKSVTEKLLKG